MDITEEFIDVAKSLGHRSLFRNKIGPSPFLLKASELYSQLLSFENLLDTCHDNFAGLHRYISTASMTKSDRQYFIEEIAAFVTSFASEIQTLNKLLKVSIDKFSTQNRDFHRTVLSSLLQRLGIFTGLSERLRKLARENDKAPSRIFSNFYTLEAPRKIALGSRPTVSTGKLVPERFSQRYTDEIAPAQKMKEYVETARNQRDSLLNEANRLHVQYSDDMKESVKMESAVNELSFMISEFAAIIDGQSDMVSSIHEVGKDTTQSVKQTEVELLKTIERSRSHQWSIIAFVVGIALLLVVLDLITP